MAYVLLRETFIDNGPGAPSPYTKVSQYWDTVNRKPFADQADAQANTPRFELVKGDYVDRFDYKPGYARGVYYNGNGGVFTRNFPVNIATALSYVAVKLSLGPYYTSGPGAQDACVDITGDGLPPYQITLVGIDGNALGYSSTGLVSPSGLFPQRYKDLATGTYAATVVDGGGHSASTGFVVTEGGGEAMGVELLHLAGVGTSLYLWSYNQQAISQYAGFANAVEVRLPYGTLVDGFFSLGTTNWRRVYSDGTGGVFYEDLVLAPDASLELDNLIYFHPDTVAEQNGAILVEMRPTYSPTPTPLTYELNGLVNGVSIAPITNQTGRFDGLAAGSYQVGIVNTGQASTQILLELQNRYGLRYYLDYDDIDSVPLRLELWKRGYTGTPELINCGQGSPVVYKSDGLNSELGGQGDVPASVGTSADLNLLVPADMFEDLARAGEPDRLYRCDTYRAGTLRFRGFLQPDVFTVPLLSGQQPLSITATDGLAALKDVDFGGQQNQRLTGHRPLLNTLVHCLSRCDIALPLRLFTNRREGTMSDADAPELLATSNRTGYWDEGKNEPIDLRTVLDACLQALGGTLVQRQGRWEVRSALEAAKDADGRAYAPAGSFLTDVIAVAPSATILPPASTGLFWIDAAQNKQVRPGWKSLTGTTDVTWLKNAYVAGKVFSDEYAWLGNGTGYLRGVAGWRPAAGTFFRMSLVQGGEKGTSHTTRWPRSAGYSTFDRAQYLQGPALPLAGGLDATPATLQFTARLVPDEYYLDGDNKQVVAPTNATEAVLSYELIVDGIGAGVQLVAFKLADSAKDTVVSVPLAALPSGTQTAELRLYAWYAADTLLYNTAPFYGPVTNYKAGDVVNWNFGGGKNRLFIARRDISFRFGQGSLLLSQTAYEPYWYELTATNGGLGTFYLSEVGVQLTPQNATWEGEDNFRADGPAGNVRPTQALEVFHADPPQAAGLFAGNRYAFAKAVGLVDGTIPTSWARAIDKNSSPLFEANVLDGEALRANPSILATGTLRHRGVEPPHLLDSVDAPFDTPGRRLLVAAWQHDERAAEVEVSLVEIGVGAGANPSVLIPTGARAIHKLYEYLPGKFVPVLRGVRGGGIRVRRL